MQAVFALLATLIAASAAGYLGDSYGHGGHGYGHGHGHAHYAPVVPVIPVKVPIATSYQHEYRSYHPVAVVKAVPVVKYVQPVVAAYPVVHHGYGHGHGGHGYGHGGHGHY